MSEVVRNILLQIAAGKVPSEDVDHLPEIQGRRGEELRSIHQGLAQPGATQSRHNLTAEKQGEPEQ